MNIKKIFKQADIRSLEFQVDSEIITRSKMVEILNDLAFFYYEIDGKYQRLDDRKISITEIISYMDSYKRWKSKKYVNDLEEAMMEPNKPGYFRANND